MTSNIDLIDILLNAYTERWEKHRQSVFLFPILCDTNKNRYRLMLHHRCLRNLPESREIYHLRMANHLAVYRLYTTGLRTLDLLWRNWNERTHVPFGFGWSAVYSSRLHLYPSIIYNTIIIILSFTIINSKYAVSNLFLKFDIFLVYT